MADTACSFGDRKAFQVVSSSNEVPRAVLIGQEQSIVLICEAFKRLHSGFGALQAASAVSGRQD